MVKELTVTEILEALGYEVKVVKEQLPKPYQFKAGDVVGFTFVGDNDVRLIVQPQYAKGLVAIDLHGKCRSSNGGRNFPGCGYKKLGELRAFLTK